MENAIKICKYLFSSLVAGPYEGEIIYIDRFEVDVDSPIGIVRLFSEGVLRPYSCLVPSTINFSSLQVTLGMKVFLGPEEIDINDADFEISLKMVEHVDLSANALGLFLPMDLKQRLRYLQRAVELCDDKGCFSDLLAASAPVPYSMDRKILELTNAVKNEEAEAIRLAAKECAGLGEGRFPASDNLLCGYILAYSAFCCSMGRKWDHIKKVNLAILEGAISNTTRESGLLIWLAANGLTDEDGCQLFRFLFSDKAYPSLLASSSASLKRNGCDWMIGICSFLHYFAF